MQISTANHSLIPARNNAVSDTGTKAVPSTEAFSTAPEPFSKETLTKGEIFAEYDLNSISPREIDELADRLRESGNYEFKEMMMLETRGERFTMHLQNSLKEAGILDEITFDPTQRFDYLSSAAEQIEMSRRHGNPTELAQENLDALLEIHQRSEETRTGQVASATTSAAFAQSLFDFLTSAA